MELFARTYPGEVAGVVLVDARHADFTRQCQVVGARSCTPPALLTALLPNGPKQELAGGNKTMQDVMNAGPFPDVPVTILTSGKKMFGVDVRFQEVWLQTQKELATLSAESEHRVCGHCGHYVHKDDPNLVVAAVNSIVQQVRKDLIVDNHRR
jgi:pimeloyl-ACP methyl ester carboxylesterase